MRYRSSGIGMDFLFRPGRPGLGTLLVAIWAGFMVATAGAAVYPPVTALVTPFVCSGEARTDSRTFSTRPGETIVSRDFECIGEDGKPRSVMVETMVATGIVYAAIAFVLLTLLGLWRGRGGREAAGAPPAHEAAPAPVFPELRARTAELESRLRSRPVAAAGSDIEARLELLERLHADGLVTDADYEAKKAEILSRL